MPQLMSYDDASWEKSEKYADSWLESLHQRDRYVAIKDFILSYYHPEGSKPIELKPIMGGCNISFRLIYDDTSSAVLRLPAPGLSQFLDEKVRYEVGTMQWLKANTSIPVPTVLHWGTSEDNPLQLGPFILMEFLDHDTDLGTVLKKPDLTEDDRAVLDPDISVERLRSLYRLMADILLQLYQTPFSTNGSLVVAGDLPNQWDIAGRPLSLHWNELVRLGGYPKQALPSKTEFPTSASYFNTLADLHISHLVHQQNDSITSESDCRQKFLARILFRKLAREGSLFPATLTAATTASTSTSSPDNTIAPFRLWCDDLRPANILLDTEHHIAGAIDWEFTYSAPAEFSHATPWWLLLEKPENWSPGLEDWARVYEQRLQCFLAVLRESEDKAADKTDEQPQPQPQPRDSRLSDRMRESWETGSFWVVYAAMKSFAFDLVFRRKLDGIFLGGDGSDWDSDWESRVELLSGLEQRELDLLVKRKLETGVPF